VLGAARIAGRAVLPAIQAAGGELVALASHDRARGQEMADSFGIPLLLDDYAGLLEVELDAVYLPLPNSLHLPWTLRAVAAGKHVLCEKPLALTRAEALEIGAAAAASRLVVAEALMYRYHPRWQTARQLVAEGRIGSLRHLQGCFSFPLRPPPEIRWVAGLGGGVLYDLGSYLLSASRWLAGEPDRVLARARRRHGVDSDGSALLEFTEEGGPVSAELAYSFEAVEHQEMALIGTEATLVLPKPFTAWGGEAIPLQLRRGLETEPESIPAAAADPYREMVAAFTASVRGDRAPFTGCEDAALNLAVLEACQRSVASGGWERP
jgi:predicted dehydrogenase